MDDELRQLNDQAVYEAKVIGVSQELRDEIREYWERQEEISRRVNSLHRGTKE